ncbi:hypothetical protein FXN61_06190 [Lentzea sp. PSKA42]|uniref:Uncharacterized protein n=1 Tax=Lentzea indica TaxID=2604800 RepID=A0ABX1FC63_9PSEU|nr:hypothetical protein [Lentzea indica]NKE56442.1 hypothetical protein [Lentzea indica]
MLLRSVVGACAGALVGIGFAFTIDGLRQYCYLRPGRTGCGDSSPLLLPPIFVFWMLVAGVLIYTGFRLARMTRGWWATGVGSGLWVVLIVAVVWFKALFLDMYQEDGHLFLLNAAVITSCVAYAIATSCTGRRRTV